MNFDFVQINGIPRLAWCAEITPNNKQVKIYHGQDVHTQANSFIEGAWEGDFKSQDFLNADFLLGSGATITEDKALIFSTPSHTLERLHSVRTKQALFLSNSLALVLVYSETQLNPTYLFYEKDFCSIVHGLNNYQRFIPLKDKNQVQIHYFTQLKIENLEIIEIAKPEIQPFQNFSDYYQRLRQALQAIVDNSRSPSRKKQYGLVTTISQGYDAAAASTIIRDFGCEIAVTFNAPERYAQDSGEEIARRLGYLQIITRNADQFLSNHDLVEAEFVASGELGTNVIFSAFEADFKDKIVVSGEAGDYFWNKTELSNNEFIFHDENLPQISMLETRLRIGFISLPLPYFGASQWNSLHEISNSEEMKAYSIGGDYDRPIPRKILEDAGIPRGSFAQENIGAGVNYRYDSLTYLKQRMSPHSYANFVDYYRHHKRNRLVNLTYWAEFLWESRSVYANFILRKLKSPILFSTTYPLRPNPGPPSYLVPWGIFILRKRFIPIIASVKISQEQAQIQAKNRTGGS